MPSHSSSSGSRELQIACESRRDEGGPQVQQVAAMNGEPAAQDERVYGRHVPRRGAPGDGAGPQRSNGHFMSGYRSAPYGLVYRGRPQTRPKTEAEKESKWKNDLFDPDSDMNDPRVSSEVLGRFGYGVHLKQPEPPSHPPPPTTATSRRVVSTPSTSTSRAYMDRYDDSNVTSIPATTTTEGYGMEEDEIIVQASTAPRMDMRGAAIAKEQKEEVERRRLKALKELHNAKKVEYYRMKALSDREADGFVVQVEGLVYGTSAEDVKTAFGQFGDISFSYIVNEAGSENEDPIARLVFERKRDAETARSKLNGAIADGKPLKVEIVKALEEPEYPIPPDASTPLPVESIPIAPIATTSQTVPTPTGPKAQRRTAPVARTKPVPEKKTMYADSIDLTNENSMEVDNNASSRPIPSGPRRGRASAPPAIDTPASILERLGMAAPAVPTGPASGRAGRGRPGLQGRLSNGGGRPMNGSSRGGGGGGGSSLMSRIK